ncbi:hypothetical protein CA51_11130 [Rosistilla oblonga]|uniref:hypothetical protein n=1 Tax=Rosistilla oblonga TaxID=2527990 RepID=UPI0011895E85|nr:hypothetical protein [Rosistilla oblonga]QDV11252.1 hypothetical protein CA51_11130 [Rosistilla oblonga]
MSTTTEIADESRANDRRSEAKSLIARGMDQTEACCLAGFRDRPGERLKPDPNTGWIPTPDEILSEAAKIRLEWPDGLEPSGLQLAGIRKNRDTRAARCSRTVSMRELSVDKRWEDDSE